MSLEEVVVSQDFESGEGLAIAATEESRPWMAARMRQCYDGIAVTLATLCLLRRRALFRRRMSKLKVREFKRRLEQANGEDPFLEISHEMKRRLEGEWKPRKREWWKSREVFMIFGTIVAIALVAVAFEVMG